MGLQGGVWATCSGKELEEFALDCGYGLDSLNGAVDWAMGNNDGIEASYEAGSRGSSCEESADGVILNSFGVR